MSIFPAETAFTQRLRELSSGLSSNTNGNTDGSNSNSGVEGSALIAKQRLSLIAAATQQRQKDDAAAAAAAAAKTAAAAKQKSGDGEEEFVGRKRIRGKRDPFKAGVQQGQLWSEKPLSQLTDKDAAAIRESFDVQIQSHNLLLQSSSSSSTAAAAAAAYAAPLRCWEELNNSNNSSNTHSSNIVNVFESIVRTLVSSPSGSSGSSSPPPPQSNGGQNGNNGVKGTTTAAGGVGGGGGYGFLFPSPIQMQAIPTALAGHDLIGIAETGSGKTLAYVIPAVCHAMRMIQQRQQQTAGASSSAAAGGGAQQQAPSSASASAPSSSVIASALEETGPDALVVVPTRELALQVVKHVETFAANFNTTTTNTSTTTTSSSSSLLSVMCVSGGQNVSENEADIRRTRPNLLVGTLGQLHKLLEQRAVSLNRATCVVVDEADAMLEEKMDEQLVTVLERTPRERQTIMFSATFLPELERVAKRILRQPFQRINVKYRFPNITQKLEVFPAVKKENKEEDDDDDGNGNGNHGDDEEEENVDDAPFLHPLKVKVLQKLVLLEQQQQQTMNSRPNKQTKVVVVFVNSQQTCEVLTHILNGGSQLTTTSSDIAVGIHGGLSSSERRKKVDDFINGNKSPHAASAAPMVRVLVATDVLARGMDIPNVTLVVNFDLPSPSISSSSSLSSSSSSSQSQQQQQKSLHKVGGGGGSGSGGLTPEQCVVKYIHRIGRTGRGGRDGTAVSFVVIDQEVDSTLAAADDDDGHGTKRQREDEEDAQAHAEEDDEEGKEDGDDSSGMKTENNTHHNQNQDYKKNAARLKNYFEAQEEKQKKNKNKRLMPTQQDILKAELQRDFLNELVSFLGMCGVEKGTLPGAIQRLIRANKFGAQVKA